MRVTKFDQISAAGIGGWLTHRLVYMLVHVVMNISRLNNYALIFGHYAYEHVQI